MSDSDEIEALRAMNRPLAPPPASDERIRLLIAASIHERRMTRDEDELREPATEEAESATDVAFVSPDITRQQSALEPQSGDHRWSRVALRTAAVVLLIAGIVAVLATRGADEPTDVVVADVDPVVLTGAERICSRSFAELGDQWQEILDATTPGYAVDLPADRLQILIERQYAFLDSIGSELATGQLPELADPETLVGARAAVDEVQAALELRGSTATTAAVGISLRLMTQLVEENPHLGSFCDVALIAWPT